MKFRFKVGKGKSKGQKVEFVERRIGWQEETMVWKVNDEIVEVIYGYSEEAGAWFITVIWEGAVDFEEFYKTEEEYEEILETLRERYPELYEAGEFRD